MKKLAIWAVCLAALGCAAAVTILPAHPSSPGAAPAARDSAASFTITLLHVNDLHGHTEPYLYNGKSVGGYSRLSTLLSGLRSSGDANAMLLLHAGDEFSRGDALTRKTLGAANIRLMSFLRFDAWTPGNGDYYDGIDVLRKRITEANFPTLAANVTYKHDGNCIARPFVVEQVGPVKVGIFGLCTVYPESQAQSGLAAADAAETARKIVPQLRKQADVVIALTHLGYLEDLKLAQNVAGIDVIVGGHSHTVLDEGQHVPGPGDSDVLIVQAGEYLRYLGVAELNLRKTAGTPDATDAKGSRWQLASSKARLIPIDANTPEDPAVKALIVRLWEATSQPAPQPTSARSGQ